MSLSRQSRLLTEAVNEPVLLFSNFASDAYTQISSTQRRIWCLVLSGQAALEQVLQRHKDALAHLPSSSDGDDDAQLLDVAGVWREMRTMMEEVDAVLLRCSKGLQEGRLATEPQDEARVRVIVRGVQAIERKFATRLNAISERVREGSGRLVSSATIVPVAVFLFSVVQLAEQVLVLNEGIRRLLDLDHPKAYDD